MTHPLTDDIAESIAKPAKWPDDLGEVVFTYDDMRAAYDLAIEHVRAKVDVQLAELRKYAGGGERLHIAWILETYFDRAMHCQLPQEDN